MTNNSLGSKTKILTIWEETSAKIICILHTKFSAWIECGTTQNPKLPSLPGWAFENTAQARFLQTLRSKSLLGRARCPLGARSRCSGVLRSHLSLRALSASTGSSKRLLKWLQSHLALEIAARTSFLYSTIFSHRALEILAWACLETIRHWRSLFEQASFCTTKSSCLFRNSFPNRSASNCAFIRAVLCATSQALQGAIPE